MWIFFQSVPFPDHDTIQSITSFICTVGQSTSSFSSSMSHITLPILQKDELKGAWELLSGLRVLVLNAPCPVVCMRRQCTAWHSLVRPVSLSLWFTSCYWSLTYWTEVQRQLSASHSWYCWPIQNVQVNLFESGYLNLLFIKMTTIQISSIFFTCSLSTSTIPLLWLPSARHHWDIREAVLHILQNTSSELSAEGRVVGESWRLRQTVQQKALVKALAVFYLVLFCCVWMIFTGQDLLYWSI